MAVDRARSRGVEEDYKYERRRSTDLDPIWRHRIEHLPRSEPRRETVRVRGGNV